ncbi:MAG: glycosyltransferase, partial [Planctomycetota bacterium]|nr:glycosyltransferase [Planctomycetota bacterium]
YSCGSFPAARNLAAQLAAAGYPLEQPVVWMRPDRIAAMRRMRAVLEQQVALDSILARPGEILFHDAASLEERILAYVARPQEREAIIQQARSNILAHFTHDALSARLLRFIARTLTSPSESAS